MRKIDYIIGAMALMVLSGCEDKKEYVPAQPDPADCMGVYFDADNEQDFIFIPGESAQIDLTIKRLRVESAADVPLVTWSDADGIVFPTTAHFDAGSDETMVTIDCSGMPLKQNVTIRVDVPEQYINHYAETLFNYQTTALMSQWEPANVDGSPVKFYFTEYNYATQITPDPIQAAYKPVESQMYVLPGSGILKIENFLNSGVDMKFALSPSPYGDFLGFHRLSPLNNYMTMVEAYESEEYGDGWYNAWYLVTDPDEEGEIDYAVCNLTTLAGNADELNYPRLYWYSDEYVFEYAFAYLKSASFPHSAASIGFWGVPTDASVVIPSYFYIYFRWDGETGM